MMYDFLAAARDADDLRPLLDAMVPLYFARTATFVRDTEGDTDEEAEARVENAVDVAVAAKPYLRQRWTATVAVGR
jgi:hypothetical protein